MYSRNLRSSPFKGEQKQGGDRRVWWIMIVTRGKIDREVISGDWQQTGEGMADVVARLPGVLIRLLVPRHLGRE